MTDSSPADDEPLRRAFARADPRPSAEAESVSAVDTVDAEALWRAVRGEAGPSEVAALAGRMAEDPALAEDWRIAAAFAQAHEDASAGLDDRERASPTASEPANEGRYARWGAVAALLAATVLLVLALPRGGTTLHPPDPGQLRGAQGGIEAVRGEGAIARDDATLEWTAVPRAVRYELHVSTPALEPVLTERALTGTAMVLPPAIVQSLPPETELLWRVEAVLDDDRRVVSPTFSLTVKMR